MAPPQCHNAIKSFAKIHRACMGRQAELFTYSASTAVRAALLSAGFFVAPGVGTGPKAETTAAYARPISSGLLGGEWLDRWGRSQAKFPEGLAETARASFEARILQHPQFTPSPFV